MLGRMKLFAEEVYTLCLLIRYMCEYNLGYRL